MRLWNKYKNMSAPAKASIWYTICNFFQKGISFIVVPIYVRLLSTSEYGEWSVFQAWVNILIIFASLNLYCGVFTKTLVDIPDSKERDKFTASMQGLGTLTTLTMFVIYLCARERINVAIGLNTKLMLLLFLYFLVYPAFSFWGARKRVEYQYRSMAVITVLVAVSTPGVSLLLLEFTKLRTTALILGYLLVQCIVGVVFFVIQFWKGKTFFKGAYWKYALKFNIPLVPHYLSLIVLGQSDRIMIKHFCSESDAGIYSFAYQIASAIIVLTSAINGSRVPWTYEQLKTGEYDRLRKISNMLVVMVAGIALMVSLLSPEIIGILGTNDYKSAVYVIPIVTLGSFFTFVYDMYATLEFYYGATKYVMYASVTGAVLNIALNAIFIPMFGFIAAAYTTLVCYIVFMLMHYHFSNKVVKMQGGRDSIYDTRKLFMISLVTVVLCAGSMATFTVLLLRMVLIVGLISVCLIKKRTIKELVLSMK